MLTKKRIPLFIVLICCIELLIYLWSAWTSTFEANNFFSIHPEFIFDKCARHAGRISSIIIFITLMMVGYFGLKKIYADDKRKDSFLILINLFTINHIIHLLFVILRFRSHGESIALSGPVKIGGSIHGIITFTMIVIVPFILCKYKHLSTAIYLIIIFHLFNISSFMIRTFFDKVKPPEHPAYHNQLGIIALSIACIYILCRVYMENNRNKPLNE